MPHTRPGGASARYGGLQALLRLAVAGLGAGVAAYLALVALIAWPDAFYRHERSGGAVTFHATAPLPDAAEQLGRAVTDALSASPLGPLEDEVDVWLVPEGWRASVFFAASPDATGLTYPVASRRNVFLRDAGLADGLTAPGDGPATPSPWLAYLLLHEIAHLQVARQVGAAGAVRMPRWLHEGLADYVALGPAPPDLIAQAAAGAGLPPERWGSYPHERVCVTQALQRLDLPAVLTLGGELATGGGCPDVVRFAIAPAGART